MSKFVVLKDSKDVLAAFCRRLSELLSSDVNLSNEFQELLKNDQSREILEKVLAKTDDIFNTEKDVELIWTTFCYFAKQQKDGDEIIGKLVSSITSSNLKFQSRFKTLNHLLSYYPSNSSKRFEIISKILSFALDIDQLAFASSYFSRTDNWVDKYNVDDHQKRQLFQVLLKIADKKSPGSLAGYKILLKYLSTFEHEDNLSEAVSLAREAVVRSIKLAEVHHYDDLLEMKAVKQLEADPESALLFKLVSHFARDELKAFEDFVVSNPQFLASFSLSEDDCLSKIRLLSLATLAARQQDLSYAAVANHLRISEGDVEYWVVQAIVSGILDGKLDQLTKTIKITHATQRVFGNDQWEQLSQKLDQWQNTVQNIHDVLNTSSSSSSSSSRR